MSRNFYLSLHQPNEREDARSVASYMCVQEFLLFSNFPSVIPVILILFFTLCRAQFETRAQFDAATRVRLGVPFGPILNLIDARSIPIIGAQLGSLLREVFSMLGS